MSIYKGLFAGVAVIGVSIALAGCNHANDQELPTIERTEVENSGEGVVFKRITDEAPTRSGVYTVTIAPELLPDELNRETHLVCTYIYKGVGHSGGPTMDCNF